MRRERLEIIKVAVDTLTSCTTLQHPVLEVHMEECFIHPH
jgi:hypothetical protein